MIVLVWWILYRRAASRGMRGAWSVSMRRGTYMAGSMIGGASEFSVGRMKGRWLWRSAAVAAGPAKGVGARSRQDPGMRCLVQRGGNARCCDRWPVDIEVGRFAGAEHGRNPCRSGRGRAAHVRCSWGQRERYFSGIGRAWGLRRSLEGGKSVNDVRFDSRKVDGEYQERQPTDLTHQDVRDVGANPQGFASEKNAAGS